VRPDLPSTQAPVDGTEQADGSAGPAPAAPAPRGDGPAATTFATDSAPEFSPPSTAPAPIHIDLPVRGLNPDSSPLTRHSGSQAGQLDSTSVSPFSVAPGSVLGLPYASSPDAAPGSALSGAPSEAPGLSSTSAGAGAGGGTGVGSSALFALLVGLAAFAAHLLSQRMRLTLAPWRPAAFVAVIERPG
jgi:hypothetical protein